jgi:predicted ATPase with chaperone activity
VLFANGKKAWERLEKTMLLGELALDGRVRPVNGVPAVLAAKREGWPAVVDPVDNLAEASLVEGVEVWGPYLSSSPFPGLSRRLDSTRQLFCYTAYFACS